MTNPTAKSVRSHDRYGSGAYGASRTSGKRHRAHGGIDFLASPAQPVYAPIGGLVSRRCHPYGDGAPGDTGVEIVGGSEREALRVKLFYVEPVPQTLGSIVREGEVVGFAVTLQARYPGISDHVHLEVWEGGARVDPVPYFDDLTIGDGVQSA